MVFGTGDGDPDAVLALHADAEAVLAELRAGHVPLDPLALPTPTPARCSPARERPGSRAGRGGGGCAVPGIRRRGDADPTPA